jgi:hypothetical protein
VWLHHFLVNPVIFKQKYESVCLLYALLYGGESYIECCLHSCQAKLLVRILFYFCNCLISHADSVRCKWHNSASLKHMESSSAKFSTCKLFHILCFSLFLSCYCLWKCLFVVKWYTAELNAKCSTWTSKVIIYFKALVMLTIYILLHVWGFLGCGVSTVTTM